MSNIAKWFIGQTIVLLALGVFFIILSIWTDGEQSTKFSESAVLSILLAIFSGISSMVSLSGPNDPDSR